MSKLNIVEILKLWGLDTSKKIKMIRHIPNIGNIDTYQLYLDGYLHLYQNYQNEPRFNCDYVVSFIGYEGNKAKFCGVYKVEGSKSAKFVPFNPPTSYPDLHWNENDTYYELEKDNRFDELEWRLIIEWGVRQICINLCEKEINEIVPAGFVRKFPGYSNIFLTHEELVRIIKNKEANKDWYYALREVSAIYMILDSKTGQQYIGSAYGKDGLWGRWEYYSRVPHGGNKQLENLIKKDSAYAKNFRFSILRVLSKSLSEKEVTQMEKFYMKMFGSKTFGLNK